MRRLHDYVWETEREKELATIAHWESGAICVQAKAARDSAAYREWQREREHPVV